MKVLKLILGVLAMLAFTLFAISHGPTGPTIAAFLVLSVICSCIRKPSDAIAVTLSVPEILMDVLDAFKLELFPVTGFSTDFSSKTAVKGDTITAHIATLPTAQDYDPTTGFANNATAAESLLTDVPVTLDTFKHVPVQVKFLSQLQSKLPLYKETVRNTGYVLAKLFLDTALGKVTAANFDTKEPIAVANFTLDSMEQLRTDLNNNKAYNRGRFGIVNTAYAQALQADDRVKSSLFYAQLNGDQGYRVFKNIAGFPQVLEYPDFPTNGEFLGGFFGDPRAIVIANRLIDFANVAEEMSVPKIMDFFPITDPETGLTMIGVAWQQPGTGDVFYSVGVLFGITAGKQGGANGAITAKAGLRLTTQ